MRAWALWAQAVAAAMMLASPAPAAVPAEVQGKPRIIDGETLEIAGRRIRLSGIDAPALDQICHRAGQEYACGRVARAVLWDLVAGREVACQPVGDAEADDTGTIAARCKAGDTNLNESMVEAGWAVADPASAAPYGQLEQDAKAARRGLWTGEFERPPAAKAE
jgi:endonuclease YncB( thermonuclease family)